MIYKKQLCGGCTVSSEKLINHTVPCKTNLNKLDLHPLVSDSIDGKLVWSFNYRHDEKMC